MTNIQKHSARRLEFPADIGSLKLGISLELDVWNLEL